MVKTAYRTNESKVYGLQACRALFAKRPDDIIKVYLAENRQKTFADLLRWAASQRRAYKTVMTDELEKLTESVHHEGICLIAREPAIPTWKDVLRQLSRQGKANCLIYLDGVSNPHNIGNIIRSAAHFGIPYVLAGEPTPRLLPASARRVAEGGAEAVTFMGATAQSLTDLQKAGFVLVGTSSHAKSSLFAFEIPKRCVFLLGEESSGLAKAVLKIADQTVNISGTGRVESLNVASAAAVLFAEYGRLTAS
jgi:TrmH RNA methyltransferase